jgi:hypothetical protein
MSSLQIARVIAVTDIGTLDLSPGRARAFDCDPPTDTHLCAYMSANSQLRQLVDPPLSKPLSATLGDDRRDTTSLRLTGRPLHRCPSPTRLLSSVPKSPRAIQVNIEIMRAFVRLRQLLSTHRDLAAKLAVLEKKYDGQFKIVFEAIRQLMAPDPPPPKRKRVGFRPE